MFPGVLVGGRQPLMSENEHPWAMPANADLETRLNRLVTVQRAAWALVAERLGLTDAELLERIAQLDSSDGNVDGRYTPRTTCPDCGATTTAGAQCHFCGATAGLPDPFSGL